MFLACCSYYITIVLNQFQVLLSGLAHCYILHKLIGFKVYYLIALLFILFTKFGNDFIQFLYLTFIKVLCVYKLIILPAYEKMTFQIQSSFQTHPLPISAYLHTIPYLSHHSDLFYRLYLPYPIIFLFNLLKFSYLVLNMLTILEEPSSFFFPLSTVLDLL